MIHWLSVNWLGIVFDDIIRDNSGKKIFLLNGKVDNTFETW